MQVLSEAEGMLAFLLVDDAGFTVDPDDAAKVLTPEALPVLEATVSVLGDLPTWATADIEAALRTALVEGLGIKPKLAFGPVRVAVTGRRVSPPLFESLELLGRDRSLARLRAALPGTSA
jgi:glutamyl-tRNA synthetase